MLVRKDIGFAILGGVSVLTIGGLLGATWVSANFTNIMEEQTKYAELIRLQGAAKIYARRLGSYEGVCRDIGLQFNYRCNESVDSFAISVEGENSFFYCADSTGHVGEQVLPIRSKLECLKDSGP